MLSSIYAVPHQSRVPPRKFFMLITHWPLAPIELLTILLRINTCTPTPLFAIHQIWVKYFSKVFRTYTPIISTEKYSEYVFERTITTRVFKVFRIQRPQLFHLFSNTFNFFNDFYNKISQNNSYIDQLNRHRFVLEGVESIFLITLKPNVINILPQIRRSPMINYRHFDGF